METEGGFLGVMPREAHRILPRIIAGFLADSAEAIAAGKGMCFESQDYIYHILLSGEGLDYSCSTLQETW